MPAHGARPEGTFEIGTRHVGDASERTFERNRNGHVLSVRSASRHHRPAFHGEYTDSPFLRYAGEEL